MEGEGTEKRLKFHEEMGIGFAAGVVSALAGSPLTLIMIQQQVRGGTSYDTLRKIANPNHFYRGFVGVSMREGLWTCGYLSFPPIVRRYLREAHPGEFVSDATARVPAALLGGFFACYLSHPFDTIKTCMQGDVERRVYGTFTETARRIYEGGPTAFYRGASFRYGRMVCAVYLIDSLQVRKIRSVCNSTCPGKESEGKTRILTRTTVYFRERSAIDCIRMHSNRCKIQRRGRRVAAKTQRGTSNEYRSNERPFRSITGRRIADIVWRYRCPCPAPPQKKRHSDGPSFADRVVPLRTALYICMRLRRRWGWCIPTTSFGR